MKIIRKIFLITVICLSFMLFSCQKKEKKVATTTFCYINRDKILDLKEGIDIIDEGCIFARVEGQFRYINSEAGKKQSIKLIVDDGYYVEGYYFTQECTLMNQQKLTISDNYIVKFTPKENQNFLIFDIRKIEE